MDVHAGKPDRALIHFTSWHFQCVILIILTVILSTACTQHKMERIDRFALVSRHNIIIHDPDSLNPLTVGNGNFAFTVDITGLQSYPDAYFRGIPLGTYSNHIWHTNPEYDEYDHSQVIRTYSHYGRKVSYYHDYRSEESMEGSMQGSTEGIAERARASAVLRENPHRMHLGVVGLKIQDNDDRELKLSELKNHRQELDLWSGEIHSYFEADGVPVTVVTVCHPHQPVVAIRINSPLVNSGRLTIQIRYPAADPGWRNNQLWGDGKLHHSAIVSDQRAGEFILEHKQDTTRYFTAVGMPGTAISRVSDHAYRISQGGAEDELTGVIGFVQNMDEGLAITRNSFRDVQQLNKKRWQALWEETAAVDFSACTDPRAFELERRVVLSRYLANVQTAGDLPAQETGLTYNSWHGKFHLEMHWWHAVHFALWGQEEVLEKQMKFYNKIRSQARNLAKIQGYEGVRWPKMIGPDGLTSPSTIGNYLVWQQPHYIYFAELLFQLKDESRQVLETHSDLLFETADFMVSFPVHDTALDRFMLAPPLIPAQERFDPDTTFNPAFELAYWNWALKTAIEWKERLGQPVPMGWKNVYNNLSVLPEADSVYLFAESAPDSYHRERYLSDHPIVLGCIGMFPGTGYVDQEIMSATFEKVIELWNWETTWGWDFPMAAMSAAALGKKEAAVDLLLMDSPKNTYLVNGHNYQSERLTIYLPGNGGLLTAVARMCTENQFPGNEKWNVNWQGLKNFP